MATLKDLALVDGKAELIAGRIVLILPHGHRPGRIAGRILRSLDDHAARIGRGEAYSGTVGFAVQELRSGRQSFSPDAAYHTGPFPDDPMRFLPGAPVFSVEVRSEGDYGRAEEEETAAKRADYFEAGTLVVWDVDPLAECVRAYRCDAPDEPIVFARGQEADAGAAVPDWRMSVDQIFRR